MVPRARATVYAPIDVSAASLEANLAACNAPEYAGRLSVSPLIGDFRTRLPDAKAMAGRHVYLYLGSSLGNFSDEESVALFTDVRASMGRGDRFLVGVDTPHGPGKPAAAIELA